MGRLVKRAQHLCAKQEGDSDGVRSLRREAHEAERECWLHGDAFCLSRREPGS